MLRTAFATVIALCAPLYFVQSLHIWPGLTSMSPYGHVPWELPALRLGPRNYSRPPTMGPTPLHPPRGPSGQYRTDGGRHLRRHRRHRRHCRHCRLWSARLRAAASPLE